MTRARIARLVAVAAAVGGFGSFGSFGWPAPARAAGPASFSASLDRPAVAPEQPFVYRVTLTTSDEEPEGFKAPDFRGLRVLGGPFTQTGLNMTMGGAGSKIERSITWSYQLALPAGAKGSLSIGAAHVRVGGKDVASNALTVRVGAAAAAAPQPQRPSLFPRGLFGDEPDEQDQPVQSSAGTAFLRAVADKKRAFVGEQVTVSWYLYVSEIPSHFGFVGQPKADGFWSEDLPLANPQGRLAWTPKVEGGQQYQVATVLQRALFPLAPGKLTVTAMEAQVAQSNFFGRPVNARRLKAEPLTIEAVALPRQDEQGNAQPAGFPEGNVGRFTLDVAADRAAVAVGDAVTLTVTVRGVGNLRNVVMPALPTLPGWKSYEPKTDVTMDPSVIVAGTKRLEWLIRPEQPGKTTIPALTLASFDPDSKRYVEAHSQPVEIVVSGGSTGATTGAPTAAGTPAPGAENVIAAEIRPIRVRATPRRSVSASFLHGPAFAATLVTPPLAFMAFVLAGRLRERLSRDEKRASRRRLRSIARRRLHAAAAHRDAGRAAAFYVEIERVLREALSEKLGVPVGGLRLDELADLLAARGMPAADVANVRSVLEACDEARFSPGGEPAGRPAQDAMLERAAALIDVVEKAPLSAGGQS